MAEKINQNKQINELLTRGVEDIIEKESLIKKLKSGKKLRIKLGIDPTSPNVHIGRAVTLWKLRAFQDLGHQIVFIIGGFTAQIGDSSDKLSKRPFLTERQVEENVKSYKKQIGKILDLDQTEFHNNNKWLKPLDFKEVCQMAEVFSVQQMLARRNFKERYEKGEEISLREFMYPMMQGYDSVMVKADVEIGGFDQLFNLKAGREIQRFYGQEPQDIMVFQMLEGLDGRKMSSSWGNVVSINDDPRNQFGKIMSLRDELIIKYFTLCAPRVSLDKIEEIKKELKKGANPRDIKARLAKEIVALYHGANKAAEAEEEFNRVFKEKQKPTEMPEIKISKNKLNILDLLSETDLVSSKGEARRLIGQKGVKINDEIMEDWQQEIEIKDGMIIQVGKRKFAKIKV